MALHARKKHNTASLEEHVVKNFKIEPSWVQSLPFFIQEMIMSTLFIFYCKKIFSAHFARTNFFYTFGFAAISGPLTYSNTARLNFLKETIYLKSLPLEFCICSLAFYSKIPIDMSNRAFIFLNQEGQAIYFEKAIVLCP